MKRIFAHLLVGAVPALALGQSVNIVCPADSCHFAPYFRGEGGLVGERSPTHVDDRGAPLPIRFVLECGRVTVSGEVEPDADGIIRQLLTGREGLACWGDGGTFELRGLRDGGWYWINDRRSSAVSPLVRLGARANPETIPPDPGGVTMRTIRKGAATYVKHEPSGRVGIIPHILPTEPIPACGPRLQNNCRVDASYSIGLSLTTPAGAGGKVGAGVTRGDEAVTVTPSVAAIGNLAGNVAQGHLHGRNRGRTHQRGHRHGGRGSRHCRRSWWPMPAAVPTTTSTGTPRSRSRSVTANMSATGYVPAVGALPDRSITVHCPAVEEDSANQGVNLVPENPFPVDK